MNTTPTSGAADLPEAISAATISALKGLLRAEERIENSSSFADSFAQESMKFQLHDAMQAARAAIKGAEPLHDSDCSLHNKPTLPAGLCDCSVFMAAQAINPGDTEAGPEGEWYCETHPDQLMGHAGCGGAGIPACARISCLMNQLRLAKQEVREANRIRDEVAAAALRVASHGQAPAWATKPTEQQILEAAEKAGLWPNTVHSWIPAFHRYHKELAKAQPAPAQTDSVQEDAARYRWLREGNDAKHGAAWHVAVNLYGCEWDAAIDAARAAQKEGE